MTLKAPFATTRRRLKISIIFAQGLNHYPCEPKAKLLPHQTHIHTSVQRTVLAVSDNRPHWCEVCGSQRGILAYGVLSLCRHLPTFRRSLLHLRTGSSSSPLVATTLYELWPALLFFVQGQWFKIFCQCTINTVKQHDIRLSTKCTSFFDISASFYRRVNVFVLAHGT